MSKDNVITINAEKLENAVKVTEKLKEVIKGNSSLEEIERKANEMERKHLISKIKVDKKFHAMTVSFSGSTKKHSRETNHTGFEEMLLEKYLEIQKLKYAVMEILELPEDWEDSLIITGITFNYDPENDMALRGMVVTMQKEYEHLNCPLNLNTPFIKFASYVDDYLPYPVEEATWDYEVSERVTEIIHNTFMYMCGDTKTIQEKLDL